MFEMTAVNLVVGRTAHAVVQSDRAVYVVGGLGGTPLDSVELSLIAEDGTLLPFVMGGTLTQRRERPTCLIAGGSLYVLAGSTGGSATATLERAALSPSDGSIGPFAIVSGPGLVQARAGHGMVVLGDVVTLIGGCTIGDCSSTPADLVSTIEHAVIRPDGSLGAFTMLPNVLLAAPRANQTVTPFGTGGALVAGGVGAQGTLSGSESAVLH
jgi:hypothetical protein